MIMIGHDKETKFLKKSRLMEVTEFNSMVNAVERFKHGLAVRAITGKKNIRGQKSQDQVFYSVLGKMLLEVARTSDDRLGSTDERQLLALKKVYLWFQSNKHVLVKSDGYFLSARKITEEIHEKKNRPFSIQKNYKRRIISSPKTPLKTIESHLKELHKIEEDKKQKDNPSSDALSMFIPSVTQDLTTIDTGSIPEDKGFFNDLDFGRESFDDDELYFGLNRASKLNRPMTAPPKMKPPKENTENKNENIPISLSPSYRQPRAQSAIERVHHELSWAKTSPTPLSKLIHKHDAKRDSVSSKKEIHVTIPTEPIKPVHTTEKEIKITDPNRIANLVMFKQFCYQHAVQQEAFMQQHVQHKHGTRQHYLEFPEKKTEAVVKETALGLQTGEISKNKNCEMRAYRSMSLKEFLDQDTNNMKSNSSVKIDDVNTNRSVSAPARVKHGSLPLPHRTPHPPSYSKSMRIIQPSNNNNNKVTVSSMYGLVDGTGKLMHTVNQQALPAPTHGWRYPMVPLSTETQNSKREASAMVLALQEGDVVQQKVIVPYTRSPKTTPDLNAEDLTEEIINKTFTPNLCRGRPLSAYSVMSNPVAGPPSQCSTRPSPRHITDVQTVYREFKSPTEVAPHSLRSAGTAHGPSRPLTAASWGSYPAYSEVTPSLGAASHHTSGTLMHRSVAETMRVKSVIKNRCQSGRSSASSYVAQLRAKKRTGGNLPSQTKPVIKKKVEFDLQAHTSEESQPAPQLSFLNIVAPMQVDPDNKVSTYVPPGGVYCGTTAAVSIAVDKFEGQFADAISDTPLSYEDLESVDNKLNEEGSDKEEQNWLKDWLSGGALDGLGMDSTREGGTTYADLISRAAILDSSGDRSYSDEAPSSNGVVGIGAGSPRDPVDFSLSPRSDPLLSHRTNETTNISDQPEQTTDGEHLDVTSPQSTNSPRSLSINEEVEMNESSSDETVENKMENGGTNENITENSGTTEIIMENGRTDENVVENGRTDENGGADAVENESEKTTEKDENEKNSAENVTSENGSENDSLLESEYDGSSDDTDFVDYTDDGETNSEFDDDDEKFVRQSLVDEKIEQELENQQQGSEIQNNVVPDDNIAPDGDLTSETAVEYENKNLESGELPEACLTKNRDEIDDIRTTNNDGIYKQGDTLDNVELQNVENKNKVQTTVAETTHSNLEDDSKILDIGIDSQSNDLKSDDKNTQVKTRPESLGKFKKCILKNKKTKVTEYPPIQQEPIIIGEDLPSMVDPQTGSIVILEENKVIENKTENLSSDNEKSQIDEAKNTTSIEADKALVDANGNQDVLELVKENYVSDGKSDIESEQNEMDLVNETSDYSDEKNSDVSTPANSENGELSPSDFDSFSSDSEKEYVMKKCNIKIVVTSATKVEKELKQKMSQKPKPSVLKGRGVNLQPISENDQTEINQEESGGTMEKNMHKKNKNTEDTSSQEVMNSVKKNEGDEDHNENTKAPVNRDVFTPDKSSNFNNNNFDNAENETSVVANDDIHSHNSGSGMITFEEVAVVTALSRPVSGRPIPSETEVRDPFVDMVASTRQKQVERTVDVHAIFAESPDKTVDVLESRINTEEEKIAIVKMQRAYRCHLARTRAARKIFGIKKETLEWARAYKEKLKERSEMRKRRAQETRSSARINQQREKNRMKKIGPHTVVYENFHRGPTLPDKDLIHDSAVDIQRCVRGWLVRQQLRKIRAKVLKQCEVLGDDLVTSVVTYRELLRKTQHRHGILKPTLTFTYTEFFYYLGQLSKFKALFKKREFWEEVEESELSAYFNDCNLFPTQDEINEVVEAVKKSMDRPKRKKKKHSETGMSLEDVLEVAFHIYPPIGAHL